MRRSLSVSPSARDHLRRALEWWSENRDKAPRALIEELGRAFRLIREHPGAGHRVPGRLDGTYRLPLSRVRYTLYYREESGVIRVLALWQSNRGDEPRL